MVMMQTNGFIIPSNIPIGPKGDILKLCYRTLCFGLVLFSILIDGLNKKQTEKLLNKI